MIVEEFMNLSESIYSFQNFFPRNNCSRTTLYQVNYNNKASDYSFKIKAIWLIEIDYIASDVMDYSSGEHYRISMEKMIL